MKSNLTIVEATQLLREKKLSAVELTQYYLERIKKHNNTLNAYITITEKEALKQAKEADRKIKTGLNLPILGIPIAFKDVYLIKGTKTTAASKVLENYTAHYTATAAQRLLDAGSVCLGKLNCDAWAHGSSGENSDFGPSKNPWNRQYIPGGSSSGSGVAVASDIAIAATGTDTGGSIRTPASFTNTVGIKPTYGRVSRYGVISMASSLDSIGHFTKTVEDSALMLSITAGADEYDATLSPQKPQDYLKNLKKGIKGMRLGVPKEYVGDGLEKEVKDVFLRAAKIFEKLGATVEEVSLPNTKYGIATYYIIQPSEVSSNLARFDGIRYGNPRSHFGDEAKRRIMLGTFTLSSGYYDAYYVKAMKVRTLIKQDFEKAFEKYDGLITPVSPTLPWKIGEKVDDPIAMYLSDVLTVSANIAGIPSLAIPAGFSSNRLPIGLQIMGKHFTEDKLYQIGHAFEQETKYYLETPTL